MNSDTSEGLSSRDGFLRFRHAAMATMFEIMIAEEEPGFAGGAARAAFDEVDRIEQELSRYSANSDITRINNLQPHGKVRVGIDAFACLTLSLRYREETGGAFDPALGALMECWVARDKSLRNPADEEIAGALQRTGMSSLVLDESAMTVGVGDTVPLLDLGAIGKGYAVDRVADMLKEWGVGSALVHGGTSSVFAFGACGGRSGWPVTLSDPEESSTVIANVVLSGLGLGGSGIKKGRHIIDPRRGRPVEGHRAAWVISESATRSDALSTACMVMSEEEIRVMVERDVRLRAIIAASDVGGDGAGVRSGPVSGSTPGPQSRVVRFGTWHAA